MSRCRWGVVALSMLCACAPVPPARVPGAMVATAPLGVPAALRVGLATRVPDIVLQLQGGWDVRFGHERWRETSDAVLRAFVLRDRIVLVTADGAERAHDGAAFLAPVTAASTFTFGDTPYRGAVRLLQDAGRLTLVHELDVEEYLRGVVPWEIGRPGPDIQAAVEAQVVAARTYAYTKVGQFDSLGFDVYPDERDQMFRGVLRQDERIDAAIRATRHLVLEHGGGLAQAYYSSTCGGHTSRIENVWPKPAQAYLEGGRDAGDDGASYCRDSRHFRWTEAWSGAELERTLHETLPRVLRLAPDTWIGGLLDLREGERDASGRLLELHLVMASGTYTVRGDSIRWVLKPRDRAILRSILVHLEIERDKNAIVRVVARGGGSGHGVGMCQTGAMGMARLGFDRDAILAHYYPGARLRAAR